MVSLSTTNHYHYYYIYICINGINGMELTITKHGIILLMVLILLMGIKYN